MWLVTRQPPRLWMITSDLRYICWPDPIIILHVLIIESKLMYAKLLTNDMGYLRPAWAKLRCIQISRNHPSGSCDGSVFVNFSTSFTWSVVVVLPGCHTYKHYQDSYTTLYAFHFCYCKKKKKKSFSLPPPCTTSVIRLASASSIAYHHESQRLFVGLGTGVIYVSPNTNTGYVYSLLITYVQMDVLHIHCI